MRQEGEISYDHLIEVDQTVIINYSGGQERPFSLAH